MHVRLSSDISPETLREATTLLRGSQLFVGGSDPAPLIEKQVLFLTLAGCKAVSEAGSAHWVATTTGKKAVGDDVAEVGQFLDQLGLTYTLRSEPYATIALVARDATLLRRYETSEDVAEIGDLFGYPKTATAAFLARNYMSLEVQEETERAAGVFWLPDFRFSQDHWKEEIEVIKGWKTILSQYGLL